MSEQKTGPVYGVPLIDTLPLGTGAMRQQMPSRADLEQVRTRNERVVAGYEVLLAHFRECQEIAKELRDEFRQLEESDCVSIASSRLHFHGWADRLEKIMNRGAT